PAARRASRGRTAAARAGNRPWIPPRRFTTQPPAPGSSPAPGIGGRAPRKRPVSASERELRLIGTPFRRVDGVAKVTGRTRYADDLAFPRTAHIKLVRSTMPHARIRNIDLAAAERMPGVLGFLTGRELPTTFGI